MTTMGNQPSYMTQVNSSIKDQSKADRDRALFDQIAESYQQKDLRMSSRMARQHRLHQTVLKLIEERPSQALLEVGCGAGFSAKYLEGHYAEYLGVDHSAELIDYANTHFPWAAFICCDALELEAEGRYHGIFMVGVLHHMESPNAQLKAMASFLASGGWIALNEPNSANPVIQCMRWIRKALCRDYSEDQCAYTYRALERDLLAAGFVDVTTRAQGIFSTPFAEVPMRPDIFWATIARLAIGIDRFLEAKAPKLLRCVSWNLVATARKSPELDL